MKESSEEVAREDYDGTYGFEVGMKEGRKCIDAIAVLSCWGSFINDPLDDTHTHL